MPMNKARFDVMSISIRDVIEAYKDYDTSDEAKEIILYFVSELTGISVDEILNMI